MSKKYLGGYLAGGTSVSTTSSDPQFNYVTALLSGDGTNAAQNNTFVDSSANALTITRAGNTTQGSFSPYGSLWSVYFTAGYINVPSVLDLNTIDYTIEFWFSGTSFEMSWGTTGGYAPIVINSAGDVYFADSTNANWAYNVNSVIIKTNTWHHYAIVRKSGIVYIYRDGAQVGTSSLASISTYNGNVVIGSYSSATTGYLSNFRCVIGTAIYTSAFTPPTSPLTSIGNTQLLICQSNRFIDNGYSNWAITTGGTSASVQRFNPFGPTANYSASSIGGSGYFDGTGDYLTTPSNSAFTLSGDFTIEGWVYMLASSADYALCCLGDGDASTGILIYSHLNTWRMYSGATNISTGASTPVGAWSHIALVRSGSGTNNITFYINGVSKGTTTYTTTYVGGMAVGAYLSAGSYYDSPYAYLSDFRVTKSAVYTAAFTPPTAPLTALSATTFLVNFTNAGIYDSAMLNDFETVGNAQISTSVVKYGTGSMSFNGSSSYLQGPVNTSYAFSTNDFTVEFWVYVTSYTTTATTVVRTTGTSGWVFQFDAASSNKMIFYANGVARLTDSASPSTGTWTYFAVVRSGTTITMYRNGTSVASATYATAINPTGDLLVGCGGDSNNTSYGLNGYIDDLRITKGYARTITTPTAAFPRGSSIVTTTSFLPTATAAPGIWTVDQMAYYRNQGLWPVPQVPVSYLVVAGGGGGAYTCGGGGGAGGLLTASSYNAQVGSTLTVTVGAGGAGATATTVSPAGTGGSGTNSVFDTITAIGGGGGGGLGLNGGSGGGGGPTAGSGYAGGNGTPGQGSSGGYGGGPATYPGGGGGGAGGAGANVGSNNSGAGGVGLASSITGTSVYYAGGGGGGLYCGGSAGAGGNGGGGAGGTNAVGTAGTANTGGGGGAGAEQCGSIHWNGANGGSGVVIISALRAAASTTGSPTVTTNGAYTVYKFTSSGTITF